MPNAAARPVPCCTAARMIVSVRAPQLPGPSSVPSSRIVVHGFGDACFAAASTRASASSGATSPGPSRSTSAHSQASFGTHSGSGWTTCASRTEPRSQAVPHGSSSAKTLSSTS